MKLKVLDLFCKVCYNLGERGAGDGFALILTVERGNMLEKVKEKAQN